MASFDEPVPVTLGDPEPLRQALLVAVERVSDVVARLEPAQPYLVQAKGFLGRTKTTEVLIGPEVIFFADETGAGVFSLSMFHPAGWPPAAGTPVPAGARLTAREATYYGFDLDPACSPARAATEITAITELLFGEALGRAWKVGIRELTLGIGD